MSENDNIIKIDDVIVEEIGNYDLLINTNELELIDSDTNSSSSIVHLELEKENTENDEDISDDQHDDIFPLDTLKDHELNSIEFKTMIPAIYDENETVMSEGMESLKVKDEDNLFTLQDQGNNEMENKEISGIHSIGSDNENNNQEDEVDFRTNILQRNMSEDTWVTNEYIHDEDTKTKNISDESIKSDEIRVTEDSESFNIVTKDDCRLSLKNNDSGDSRKHDKIALDETDNLSSQNELKNNVDEAITPVFDDAIDLKDLVISGENSSEMIERTNTISLEDTNDHIHKNFVDHEIVPDFSDTNNAEVVENRNSDRHVESSTDIISRSIELDNTISLFDTNEIFEKEKEVNKIESMTAEKDEGDVIKSVEDNVVIIQDITEIIERTSIEREEGVVTEELLPLQIRSSGIIADSFERGLSPVLVDNHITENDDIRIHTIEIKDDKLYSVPSPPIDESDFLVNVIERDDSRDTWMPNSYIHNDNEEVEVSQHLSRDTNNQGTEIADVTDSPATQSEITDRVSKEVEISQVEQPVVLKPIGIDSLSIFNSLNSIVVMLFGCTEFRRKMIEYHQNDEIAYFDFDSHPEVTLQDGLLINDICKLFALMLEENEIKAREIALKIRQYFRDHTNPLNLFTGYNYVLNKINTITKKVENKTITSRDEGEIEFLNFKIQNDGFVLDLFYGQMLERIFCGKCRTVHGTQYRPINSISLKIPKNKTSINLEDCIKDFLSESKLDTNNDFTCCENPVINIIREITHAPKYFFIYIDRDLEKRELDHTYVDADNGVIIAKKDGFVLYSLYSVIDQIHINQSSHHVTKCLSDLWWHIGDRNVKRIEEYEVVSEYTIGFMLKKQDDC